MIFQSHQDAIDQLISLLKEELFPPNNQITALSPEGETFAKPIATALNLNYFFLPASLSDLGQKITGSKSLVIVDDGQLRVGEYPEFIDLLRRLSPTLKLILATPVIPQSEEAQFKQLFDQLITIHIEPLFFSMTQFYDVSLPH